MRSRRVFIIIYNILQGPPKRKQHVPPLRSERACVNVSIIRTYYYYTCRSELRVARWCKYIVLLYIYIDIIMFSVALFVPCTTRPTVVFGCMVHNATRTSALCAVQYYNNNMWAMSMRNNMKREKISVRGKK